MDAHARVNRKRTAAGGEDWRKMPGRFTGRPFSHRCRPSAVPGCQYHKPQPHQRRRGAVDTYKRRWRRSTQRGRYSITITNSAPSPAREKLQNPPFNGLTVRSTKVWK